MNLAPESAVDSQTAVPVNDMVDIPIESIFIADKRRKGFDPEDVGNKNLVAGMGKTGLINPVDVRRVGDRYELVCGRRRLWAAKQLGWTTILARVGTWRDDEIAFLVLQENTLRRQLSPAEEARAIQGLMERYAKMFGDDPGRRIGGLARAAGAKRDPETKRFVAEPTAEKQAGSIQTMEAGQGEKAPRAFSELLARDTAKSVRAAQLDAQIGRSLSPEQLDALAASGRRTKAELRRLAAIESDGYRAHAVRLVCEGAGVEEAIAQVVPGEPGRRVAPVREDRQLSDEEWLLAECGTKLRQFQDPTAFRHDAIMWRRSKSERVALRAKALKLSHHTNEDKPSLVVALIIRLSSLAHPCDWSLCGTCLGLNTDYAACATCGGYGYTMKVERE